MKPRFRTACMGAIVGISLVLSAGADAQTRKVQSKGPSVAPSPSASSATTASAGSGASAPPATAQTEGAKPARETTYDFEDDLVTGDLVRPDGELLNVRRRGQRSSLIRIREHFVPEMLKSVENL
jgi:hypothetical protein